MKNQITQLHNVTPDEFEARILSGVKKQLEKFSEKFTLKEPTDWITRKETSEILGVSLPTIHDWCKKNILTPYKIGNRVRFRRKDIDEVLINSNRTVSKNDI